MESSHSLGRDVQVEVVVSDDEQSATLQAALSESFPKVVYTAGPGAGPAANRNHGARVAQGDWILFLDDDCLPQPGWIEAMLEATDSAQVLEGMTYAGRDKERFDEESPTNLEGDCMWTCNLGVERLFLESLNGFDEDYIYAAMEDVDFQKRVQDANGSVRFVKDAKVLHPWRRMKGIEVVRRRMLSREIFWQKHPETRPSSPLVHDIKVSTTHLLDALTHRFVRFRGRGFIYEVINNGYRVYWSLTRVLRTRK